MAATGISLHIGVNKIDPGHYGTDGALAGCEADARDMASLAKSRGFKKRVSLLTRSATSKRVLKALDDAADTLKAGDIFFLTYSGHGAQVPDDNGSDEEDEQDETWCLYDRMLIDDELYDQFGKFAPGVRILMLSDSCHSGTVAKKIDLGAIFNRAVRPKTPLTRFRLLPLADNARAVKKNRKLYARLQREHRTAERAPVAASVLLISGCQDNQLSADGARNGLFTATLKQVFKRGAFRGGYRKLHRDIVQRMPPVQTPNYFRTGQTDAAFERQSPFTI